MELHAQYIKQGEMVGEGANPFSGIGHQVVSNCIVHQLSFLWIYFSLFLLTYFLFITTIITIFYFISTAKLFLSQATSFTFFFPLIPLPNAPMLGLNVNKNHIYAFLDYNLMNNKHKEN